MIGLGLDTLAPTPGGAMLAFAMLLTIGGHVGLTLFERFSTPKRAEQVGSSGALRRESPAVVNLLANDGMVSAAGLRATVVDLAARGWVRILPPVDDDEVSRVRPAASAFDGDALLPHERLALQHVLARFTTDHAIPARHLAVDIRGSWWRRFRRLVEDEARRAVSLMAYRHVRRIKRLILACNIANVWLMLNSMYSYCCGSARLIVRYARNGSH